MAFDKASDNQFDIIEIKLDKKMEELKLLISQTVRDSTRHKNQCSDSSSNRRRQSLGQRGDNNYAF